MKLQTEQRIVLASSNRGKLKEFSEILAPLHIQVLPQSELDVSDAEETGLTFVENALIKARHACRQTGLPALADDSGLEVDALQGAPGIYSARFSPEGNDQSNNTKLLQALADVPEPARTARYRCLLVFLRHANDPTPLICQGTLEGSIGFTPKGENGFGYDPLFQVAGTRQSAAELSPQEKHRISHRGQAVKAFMAQISSYLK